VGGPFVHRIDPIVGTIFGLHLWWYGLSYSLGFLNAHLFLRRHRRELGLSLRSVYNATLSLAVGVLLGGRALVIYYEWPFYRTHRHLIPAVWLGGMATHGLIIGGLSGVALYCVVARKPLLSFLDTLAVPAALILGLGRIGNFIDGQIVGSLTTMPWGVKFPNADGFRHPVVLYDGLKNLALIPLLLWLRRKNLPQGRLGAIFLFLYAFLRIFIDEYREYPLTLLGWPAGQFVNVTIAIIVGTAMAIRWWLQRRRPAIRPVVVQEQPARPGWRVAALAAIMAASLVIASDATRDIPATYGGRHPGLTYSVIYPPLR
jgi:phosphatidylglycerol:prolipoprotein diacylglycerol transferase